MSHVNEMGEADLIVNFDDPKDPKEVTVRINLQRLFEMGETGVDLLHGRLKRVEANLMFTLTNKRKRAETLSVIKPANQIPA